MLNNLRDSLQPHLEKIGRSFASTGISPNGWSCIGLVFAFASAFVYGWDIDIAKITDRSKIIDQAEEHEFFNQVKYTVQTGALKDASLRVRYSYLRSSDTYNNVSGQYVSNVIGSTNEWRLFLDIPVKLF